MFGRLEQFHQRKIEHKKAEAAKPLDAIDKAFEKALAPGNNNFISQSEAVLFQILSTPEPHALSKTFNYQEFFFLTQLRELHHAGKGSSLRQEDISLTDATDAGEQDLLSTTAKISRHGDVVVKVKQNPNTHIDSIANEYELTYKKANGKEYVQFANFRNDEERGTHTLLNTYGLEINNKRITVFRNPGVATEASISEDVAPLALPKAEQVDAIAFFADSQPRMNMPTSAERFIPLFPSKHFAENVTQPLDKIDKAFENPDARSQINNTYGTLLHSDHLVSNHDVYQLFQADAIDALLKAGKGFTGRREFTDATEPNEKNEFTTRIVRHSGAGLTVTVRSAHEHYDYAVEQLKDFTCITLHRNHEGVNMPPITLVRQNETQDYEVVDRNGDLRQGKLLEYGTGRKLVSPPFRRR